MELFSNQWWAYVATNYNLTIAAVFGLIMTVLKVIAVIHPSVTTDKIIDLLKQWFSSTPVGSAIIQVEDKSNGNN